MLATKRQVSGLIGPGIPEEPMKVDGKLGARTATAVIDEARRHEKAGYDGLWSSESAHDPFLPLVLAAEHTERIEVGTAIAVAFARSPMQLAYTAHDLQSYSGGRFTLGLGSQIRPHIERRFSMPWRRPAARMREFIMAMRAIWSAWNDGTKLSFRGDFYTHTLMTPFFAPPPAAGGAPKVFLAAVGETMTEVAGEVADGLLVHAFSTERYLREVTVPALGRGLAKSGRTRADAAVSCLLLVATGRTELSRSTRDDKWTAMGDLIDDDVLHAFSVVAEPGAVAPEIRRRFGGLVDRVSFYPAYEIDTAAWEPVLQQLR